MRNAHTTLKEWIFGVLYPMDILKLHSGSNFEIDSFIRLGILK